MLTGPLARGALLLCNLSHACFCPLERVRWRDNQTGTSATHDILHVFAMTGPDLSSEDLAAARWPLARTPHLLETNLPGVFAAGHRRTEARRITVSCDQRGRKPRIDLRG
jgi:thioredoxin reductase